MHKRNLSADETAVLLLLAAIIFGTWFRIMPAWQAGFPINDGGMFYTMILDLQANHFIAPLFTTYNLTFIPFAYPPAGFYIGAGISSLFHVSPLTIIRWLPGIINSLSIPAFYIFAKEILKNKFQGSIATLVYAMIPHLTSWLSMGGGLTRSFGMLFMLLTLGCVHRVFTFNLKRDILGAILFGGLTVLSHTEAPIYTITLALYIWSMKSRSIKGMLAGIIIALGVLIVTAPWYGTIINRHGLEPFLSISQTGAHSLGAVFKILDVASLTEEPYLGILGALGILGIASLVARKEYFIPLMLPVIYLSQPRSAHVTGNIPLALAAGFFFVEILLPWLDKIQPGIKKLSAFLIVISIYMLGNSLSYAFDLSMRHISGQERNAMHWVEQNTRLDSTFLVITGNQNAFCDPINEWFPALTKRKSLTTIQGSEWLLDRNFGNNVSQVQRLQGCIDEGMWCFNRETSQFDGSYDYVYISIASSTNNCELSESSTRTTRGLVIALENEPGYSIAYRSEKAILFQKK